MAAAQVREACTHPRHVGAHGLAVPRQAVDEGGAARRPGSRPPPRPPSTPPPRCTRSPPTVGFPLILKPRTGAGALGHRRASTTTAELDAGAGPLRRPGRRARSPSRSSSRATRASTTPSPSTGTSSHDFVVALLPERARGDAAPLDLAAVRHHQPDRRGAPSTARCARWAQRVIEALGIGTVGHAHGVVLRPEGAAVLRDRLPAARRRRVGPLLRGQRRRRLPRVGERDRARRTSARAPSRQYAAGIVALRPDRDGTISGYCGRRRGPGPRYGEWVIDAHLPDPGTPTQPVEAGLHGQRLGADAPPRLRRAARHARRRRAHRARARRLTGRRRDRPARPAAAAHAGPRRSAARRRRARSRRSPPAGRSASPTTPSSTRCSDGRSRQPRACTAAGWTCSTATRVRRRRARRTGPRSTSCRSSTSLQLDGALGRVYAVARRGGARPAASPTRRCADAEAVRPARRRAAPRAGSAQRTAELRRGRGARRARAVVAGTGPRSASCSASAAALVVAGGHVGVLLHVLQLFARRAAPRRRRRLVGRGDGADRAGACSSTTARRTGRRTPRSTTRARAGPRRGALPHARRRLRLDDPARMAELAAPVRAGRLPAPRRRRAARPRPGRRAARRTRGSSTATAHGAAGVSAADRDAGSRSTGCRSGRPLDAAAVDRFLGAARGADRRGRPVHVPVPRRGRRGAPRAPGRRAARPAAAAPAARHRPVVRRARAARGLAGRVPARGRAAASTTSASTTRSTRKLSHSPVGTSSVCFAHGYDDAGLDLARPGGPARRADRAGGAAARRCAATARVTLYLPARFRRTVALPAAGRARRRRLPAVRRGEDRAGQPDPPPRRRRDRRRLRPTRATGWSSTPTRPPHARFVTRRAAAAAGGRAAAGRPAVRPVPAGVELRRRRLAVAPPTARPTSTASLAAEVGLVRVHRHAAPTTAAGRCSTRW